MSSSAPRAVLLSIGSELLLGETLDSNAAWLGHELAMLGCELRAVHQLLARVPVTRLNGAIQGGIEIDTLRAPTAASRTRS